MVLVEGSEEVRNVEGPVRQGAAASGLRVRPMHVRGTQFAAAIACVSSLALLTACGAKKDKAATQVAAKVNKEEISVHQINFVLQRTPGITAESADAASRQILDRLINQELAVQQAHRLDLDRNPSVVQALEAARREVLARAYLDSLGEGVPKPTAEEVADFYAKKPALFKERRVYTFQEVNIAGTPQQIAEVEARLQSAKSIPEFADYLKGSGLRHAANLVTQPAESLPLELLDRFAAMSDGQALLLQQPGGAKALLLVSARSAPVDQAMAAPAIEKYLLNDRKRIKTEADMKALRAGAQIQFLGKFAEAPASAPASAAAAVPAADAAASASAAASSVGDTGLSPEAVTKGVSGLK